MFLRAWFWRTLDQFLVAAALALPEWEDRVRIASALINRTA